MMRYGTDQHAQRSNALRRLRGHFSRHRAGRRPVCARGLSCAFAGRYQEPFLCRADGPRSGAFPAGRFAGAHSGRVQRCVSRALRHARRLPARKGGRQLCVRAVSRRNRRLQGHGALGHAVPARLFARGARRSGHGADSDGHVRRHGLRRDERLPRSARHGGAGSVSPRRRERDSAAADDRHARRERCRLRRGRQLR